MWDACAAEAKQRGGLSVCNLGEEACLPGHSYGPAVRGYYLIHYVLSGQGEYQAHGERFMVSAGQGFLILPGEITTYQADAEQPWHYLWIGYRGSGAAEITQKAGFSERRLVFDLPEIEWVRAQLMEAKRDMQTLRLGEVSVLGVLLRLMARVGEYNAAPDLQQEERMAKAYFRRAAWYIEGALNQGVRVTDVASFVGLCRSQLFRVFREEAGMSPQEWIQRARLRHAGELLRERPMLSLDEVAVSSGYSGAAQMSAAFRKYLQSTPGEYRLRRENAPR